VNLVVAELKAVLLCFFLLLSDGQHFTLGSKWVIVRASVQGSRPSQRCERVLS
jgi:hypothetical protein